MKKTFIIILTLIFVAGAAALPLNGVAYAVQSGGGYAAAAAEGDDILNILTDFVTKHPDRTCGTEGELNAALYLDDYLSKLGYQTSVDSFQYRNEVSDALESSRNVIAVKEGASDLQVIIGAHYDNVTALDMGAGAIGGDGTGDNGTGVTVLLKIAELIKDDELPFTVKFVLFGAEEVGLYGSRKFIEKMTGEEKAATLLMVNFDHVGIGESLYMYADEVKRGHAEFVMSVAESGGYEVSRPPTNRNIVLNVRPYNGFTLLPYTHVGLSSDNAVFLNEGINTINFLSTNWKDHLSFERESSVHPNILYTSEDTLSNFLKYYSESGIKQMNTAVNVVVDALRQEGFVKAMEEGYQNKTGYTFWTSSSTKAVALLISVAVVGILCALYYKKLDNIQKKAKKIEDTEAKQDIKVFEDF